MPFRDCPPVGSAVCTSDYAKRPAGAEAELAHYPERSGSAAPGRGPILPGGVVMAIRPNDEERSFGADRERQREVSNENSRSARGSNGESAARGDGASDGAS